MRICFTISVCLFAWICVVTDAAGPSDSLVKHWRVRFRAIDVNHDNVLSIADAHAASQRVTDSYGMTGDKATAIRNAFETWWESCVKGQEDTLSQQQFIDAYTQCYSADPEGFKANITSCYITVAGIFDVNDDDAISKDEFLKFTKSFGHNNAAMDGLLFQAFNPTDGKVPIPDFVAYFVGLLCEEKEHLVYDALLNGA